MAQTSQLSLNSNMPHLKLLGLLNSLNSLIVIHHIVQPLQIITRIMQVVVLQDKIGVEVDLLISSLLDNKENPKSKFSCFVCFTLLSPRHKKDGEKSMLKSFATCSEKGLLLSIRVVPNSAKFMVLGEQQGELKVKICAPPIEGAANKAVIEWIAKTLSTPKSNVSIKTGSNSKSKLVLVLTNMTAKEASERLLAV
jgi:uncharacterized protein (TIGR00251 family)